METWPGTPGVLGAAWDGRGTNKRLSLVLHFHQPVGNLDAVVAHATDRCYRPFLETLARYPELPMTLHYSGCLLEWLEANAPDVTDLLRELSERGQVELMTGGFYEPILAALPRRDQTGQIRTFTEHLATHYGADATGLWLTERVWEQDVVPGIVAAGVRYTVVDDTIFHSVGVTDDELTGPFVTDHEGLPLLVYPGDRNLRYLIPYKKVARVVDYIRSGSDDRLFVYADDGEKFGEWPDTYERVHEKGWLASFFEELVAADDLDVVTLGSHAAEAEPHGRVYLPSSSYEEMLTWALPAEARLTVGRARHKLRREDPEGLLPFVRGAPWRAFLAKYPEVNQLQKRMLHVGSQVHDAGAPPEALRELYRAQCNCAYWHGAFGGVYLAFMRTALWHHLMRAEAAVARRGDVVELVDLDGDTRDEVFMTGSWGAAVIAVSDARVIELDEWSAGANLLAVAARHREAYHVADEDPPDDDESDDEEMTALLARPEVDRESLVFDEHPLGGLVDIVDGVRVQGYEVTLSDGAAVFHTRLGNHLAIAKELRAGERGLACAHRFTNEGGAKLVFTFASETSALPLNLGRETAPDDLTVAADGWQLAQEEAEVTLEVICAPAPEVKGEPIQTASTSLEGLQTMFQGTIVTSTWHLLVPPGETREIRQELVPVPRDAVSGKKDRGVSA